MRVAIFCQYLPKDGIQYFNTLLAELARYKIEYAINKDLVGKLSQVMKIGESLQYSDSEELRQLDVSCLITMGGDGTILTAMTYIKGMDIPILGINLGRLGFLASIEKKYISNAIRQWTDMRYSIDERTMLQLETNKNLFGENAFALNDFTLHKRDTASMIKIHAFINGEFLNSYWADGLIVSTPTGSTGYSLSCGGPIILPRSGNLVITPVAPHNLNVRPIVISDDTVISFEVEGRTESYLATLDSRSKTITNDFQLAVRKCDFPAQLIRLDSSSFMKTLRNKLAWGTDVRNKDYES